MQRCDDNVRSHSRGVRIWMRRLFGTLALTAVASAGTIALEPAGPAEARLAASINLSARGPLGAVTIVGDSVLMGSALTSPTLPDQLVANGWGPIRLQSIA